jgi:5-methylcytosine-specific restriction endonuclease McrA
MVAKHLYDAVIERDRACVYCGDLYGPFEVDHIVARQKGGKDILPNLALACRRCNQVKGAKDVVRFLTLMRDVREGRKRVGYHNKTGKRSLGLGG